MVIFPGQIDDDRETSRSRRRPARISRRERERQDREAKDQKQAKSELAFRIKQADMASKILNPTLDDVNLDDNMRARIIADARTIALEVIEHFPTVESTPQMRRTRAAESQALTHLAFTGFVERAISLGFNSARDALDAAFNELRSNCK
jgi:hypothetical protein